MSSRRRQTDLEFGSDSFLDVVANIVGILIILIVIAGLKVARQPVAGSIPVAPEVSSPATELEIAINLGNAEALTSPAKPQAPPQRLAKTEVVEKPVPRVVTPWAPPADSVTEVQSLEQQMEQLLGEEQRLAEQTGSMNEIVVRLKDRLQAARRELKTRQDQLELGLKSTRQQQDQLAEAKALLARLKQEVLLAENAVNVESLEHRVTPVSRVVQGPEKHYRIDGNRVAEVPIEALVGRVKEQIERKKDWLMRMPRHQGQVGPVEGFSLKYVIQRESGSVIDELQMGQQVFRISVTQWVLSPERDLKSESASEAMTSGSRFIRSLSSAEPGTSVTFWVYPDSFETYRVLQRYAHEHGFQVAGRPLPHGMPIAGSPQGSRSAAQ